jgi:hypothetical protein
MDWSWGEPAAYLFIAAYAVIRAAARACLGALTTAPLQKTFHVCRAKTRGRVEECQILATQPKETWR